MKMIKWTDAGPVKESALEVDESGGLYVMEGPCGSGKSILLNSLDDALNPERKSNVPVRDGAPRAEVDVFGEVTLRRSKQSRRLGHLEVETLSGRFSIKDLVDPGFDSPASNDNVRIKALIQLNGDVKADAALFYPLVGGQQQFDEFVPSTELATNDLVTMAAKVKASFEKAARHLEAEKDKLYAQAEAARMSANGVDTTVQHDADILAAEYEKVTREDSRLQEAAKSYIDAEKRQLEAKAAIEKAEKEYKGITVDAADEQKNTTEDNVQELQALVDGLKKQLAGAEASLALAKHQDELAAAKLDEARMHSDNLDALHKLADAKLPEPVIQLDLDTSSAAVIQARKAVENGAVIRNARLALENSLKLKLDAKTSESKSLVFRDAAQATDTVLAEAVKRLGLPLSVSNGRLIITNSDRNATGEELFADLSKGERTAMVIDIAIEAVKKPGRRGMFVIDQEFFEGLDQSHILDIARKLEGSGVVAITAKAADGDGISTKVVDPFPVGV